MLDPQIIDALQEKPPNLAIEIVTPLFFLRLYHLLNRFFTERERIDFAVDIAVCAREHRAPPSVDTLPLQIEHIVVREHVFARIEINLFDACLRLLERARNHRILYRLVLGDLEGSHHTLNRIGREDAHEVIFERYVELCLSRIPLPARATAQLIIDAARIVPLGADDRESPDIFDLLVFFGRAGIAAELDVDSAARHVGRNGNGAAPSGLSDDFPLTLVIFRIEDFVRDAFLLEVHREKLVFVDRGCADKHGLALLMLFLDRLRNCFHLAAFALEDEIIVVAPSRLTVCRYDDRIEPVHFVELLRRSRGSARHACQLGIEAEIILERNRCEGTALLLDRYALLGLDCLMEALRPAPPRLETAGELIDYYYLPVTHNVILVPQEQRFGAHRSLEVVDIFDTGVRVYVVDAERGLRLFDAGVAQLYLLVLQVRLVIDVLRESARNVRKPAVERFGIGHGGRDDERGTGFVDKNGVYFVDDREMISALIGDALAELPRLILAVDAQEAKAKLVVGPVRDVGTVRVATGYWSEEFMFHLEGAQFVAHRIVLRGYVRRIVHKRRFVIDDRGREPECIVYLSHPYCIAARKVIVDGDDVDAFSCERIEVRGQRGDERFALAGTHLGNAALVEHHAADELHIKMALAERPSRSFAHSSKRFRCKSLKRLPLLEPRLELCRLLLERGI